MDSERDEIQREHEETLDQNEWKCSMRELMDAIKEFEKESEPIKDEANAGLFLGRHFYLWHGVNFKQLHIDEVLSLTLGGVPHK